MTRLAGSKLLADDFQIPDVVTAFGNGTNSITATTFTDLPTNACVAAITNPHPTASLVVLVEFGGWLTVTTLGDPAVRICPRVSGSLTLAAGIGSGGNGPIGWGEIPLTGGISTNPQQMQGCATYVLPASATPATFTMQALRDSASGGQNANYCTIRIIPLYYSL
jgi:hypothetical protein